MPKTIKLSPPMIELLTDVATNDQMYIDLWMRWHKTAQALISRGLAYVEAAHRHHNPYELRITDEGRAEAIRRGIITQGATDAGSPREFRDALTWAGAPWGAIVDGYQKIDTTWRRIDRPEDIDLEALQQTHPTFARFTLDDAAQLWRESIGELERTDTGSSPSDGG